jgi:hypothetical protein
MKSKLSFALAVLFAGTAAVAAAQTPGRAQTFAAQLQQYQNLSASTGSTYVYRDAPALGNKAQDPVAGEPFGQHFADLQSASSNSSNFEPAPALTRIAADPVGHESFGDKFAQMQAASSDSGEFGFRAGTDAPSALANNTNVVGKRLAAAPRAEAGSAERSDIVATQK